MMPSLIESESARLDALDSYRILDSLPEEDYDAITQLAAQLCQTPISLITLLDDHRQWFKSSVGVTERQTPREFAFCTYAIQTPGQLMEVPDARLDSRFVDNPLTTGSPHVIFYAGMPLVDDSGFALGTLCVIDNKPNKLTGQQAANLKALARQVVTQLQLRRSQALLNEANQQLHTVNAALHESNRVLQTVVDHCPAGLVLWRSVRSQGQITDFEYVLTNPVNARIAGLSVAEMTGKTLKTLFPNVLTSPLFERLVTVVETGEPQQYELHEQFDQINVWGNFSLIPLGDGVLFTFQDITRLKETEDQLRTHTENLELLVLERTAEMGQLSALQNAILQHAGFAIISTDTGGVIQTVNPAAERMFGYPAEVLIDQCNVLSLCDPEALASKARRLSGRLGRPVPVDFDLFTSAPNQKGYECTMVSQEGRPIPTFLITTPLRDTAETIIGYVFMATDITTLKTTRSELQRKNQELNTFFEVALDLHCIARADGTILKTNRAWQTTLGYSAEELLTMNHFELVHPKDRDTTRLVVGQVAPDRTNGRYINRFRRKNGTYRVIEWNVVAIDKLLYASARDITDRQRVEKQLKKLNQRLQLATQAAELGIWEYDLENDALTWDERMYAIHGIAYQEKPVNLQFYRQLVHPDDLPAFEHRRHPGQITARFTSERRIIRPDGTVRYTELHGIRISSRGGRPIGSVGVVRDITQRKDADLAMRRSEERYRSLVDNLQEVVFQTNQLGEWTFLSSFWTTMIGYSVDESLGKPFYAYVSPAEQPKNYELYRAFAANGRSSARVIVRYQHKNGHSCWAEVFAQALTSETGQTVGATGTITDITEQKQALDDLRRSEQRFRAIAENINEVFWIHSADPFKLLYVNPAYERITGLVPDLLTANPLAFLERVPAEDHSLIEDALKQYVAGQELAIQFRLQVGPSTLRWFTIRTFVKKSEDGVPLSYIGVANDITSQKEKELVLQQSLAREQELNRLKSQFVATASHEFRTPLATIQSSVDLIKLYNDQPSATTQASIQRHLSVIEKEIVNFSDLLADILTFGKIEVGKIPFAPQPVEVPGLIADVIATHFSERPDGRTVRVSLAGTPRPIRADKKLISHALVNLLSNAFKYSTTNPALHIAFASDQLELIVSDNGIGIPADELVHLFETFFRARNAINIQGSGLGLVITRQFVEQHGGKLEIQSQENQGTTCTITLPG